MPLKAFLTWILIALAETVHGILRVKFLNRRLGARRARQVGVLTGTVLILIIGWFALPWIGPSTVGECVLVGVLWAALMTAFDVGLGRLYFGLSWRRIARDFNPREGGYLGFGMAALLLTPLFVAWLRGIL